MHNASSSSVEYLNPVWLRLAAMHADTILMPVAGTIESQEGKLATIFIQADSNEFQVAGSGDAQVTFMTEKPGPPIVGIESIDEEFFENDAWIPRRRMNGDETSQGRR